MMSASYSEQSHSLLRLLISIFIDKNVSSILQQVVVIRYLQQCGVLNVFQTDFHPEILAQYPSELLIQQCTTYSECTDSGQAPWDCEQKTTSCSQDERFAV